MVHWGLFSYFCDMEPQTKFALWDSVYIPFKSNSVYKWSIGIVVSHAWDKVFVDLGFWDEHAIEFSSDELQKMQPFVFAKAWILDKLPTILTILLVLSLCIWAYMMASQKPKKQVQKDQVIEIGKVISSLQDKKYVQLSRQRDLKRQLEASYIEVSKIDTQIIAKREEMMQLVNPSDSNLYIQFSTHDWE